MVAISVASPSQVLCHQIGHLRGQTLHVHLSVQLRISIVVAQHRTSPVVLSAAITAVACALCGHGRIAPINEPIMSHTQHTW